VNINTLLLEKEQMAQEKSNMATELKKLQESHEVSCNLPSVFKEQDYIKKKSFGKMIW